MLYSILIYSNEADYAGLSKADDDALVAQHLPAQQQLSREGRLGPVIRLMPTTAARTLRTDKGQLIDGPFAETKEQLLGLYIVDCDTPEQAAEAARLIPVRCARSLEIRPISWCHPGVLELPHDPIEAPVGATVD